MATYNYWEVSNDTKYTLSEDKVKQGMLFLDGQLWKVIPCHDDNCECIEDAPWIYEPVPESIGEILIEKALMEALNIVWCDMMLGEVSEDDPQNNKIQIIHKVVPVHLLPA